MSIEEILDSPDFRKLMAPYDSGSVEPKDSPRSSFEVEMTDIWKIDAQPSPDGRLIHTNGLESKPVIVKVLIVTGTNDDGVIIDGGGWGVVVENSMGRGTIHVWTTGFNQDGPNVTMREGQSSDEWVEP